MRRFWMISAVLLMPIMSRAAVPSSITYQGALKEEGVPVHGVRQMMFRLTNSDGSEEYWSSGMITVNISYGLFSVVLTPTNVSFESVTPFIEISVEGETLSPREPMTSTAYALAARTIENPARLIPSGMIAMFSGACPDGWATFSAMEGRFPMGNSSYGETGGSASHAHAIVTDGAHDHDGKTASGDTRGVTFDSFNGEGPQDAAAHNHRHSIQSDGAHNHGSAVGVTAVLPPYLGVVFCQKN